MSLFLPNRHKVPGVLVGDLLALSRGEVLTARRRPSAQPHHVTCTVCQFDRWDGHSPHRRQGKRFAKTCLGPTLAQRQAAAGDATVSSPPLVAELLELASPIDGAPPAPEAAPLGVTADPHLCRPLGTAKPKP